MKLTMLMALAALGLAQPVWADSHECPCSAQCMKECKAGNGEKCECELCDCKEGGSCDEKCADGTCPHPKHKKKS